MFSIGISNIPLIAPNENGFEGRCRVTKTLLDGMFSRIKSRLELHRVIGQKASVDITEAGNLDATKYRIHEGIDLWATITPGNNGCVSVQLEMSKYHQFDEPDIIFVLRAYVRGLRNYCEEYYEHHSEAVTGRFIQPVITSFSLPEELIASDVEDELRKAMMPTELFSIKQFIVKDPGEPFFVLLGRDPQAPDLLRNWADLRECCYTGVDDNKIAEARGLARAMEAFKADHPHRGMSIEKYEEGYHTQQMQQRDD